MTRSTSSARSARRRVDQAAFTRLRPVADELKLAADWRPKLDFPADSGKRPDLASLGPFRWHPYPAPDWSLPDHTGETRLLSEFKGRPVVVLFYLGSGCSHCIEQLNTFGPVAKEFADAGIDLIAIGTERSEELHKTYTLAKEDAGFPFPILADESLRDLQGFPRLRRLRGDAAPRHVPHRCERPRPLAGHFLPAVHAGEVAAHRIQAPARAAARRHRKGPLLHPPETNRPTMNRRTFLATTTAFAASAVFSRAQEAKKRPHLKKAVNLGMAGGVKGSVE